MSGAVRVRHDLGEALEVEVDGTAIARYDYAPTGIRQSECPAPYFHPLRTLAGDLVTANRPHDHRWHKGLAMTASHLSEQNFWGGGSYRPDAPGVGYVDLPNVGSLQHRAFEALDADGDGLRFVERIDWITQDGERWIDERRTVVVRDVDPAGGSWALEFGTELTNVRGEELRFGSPTVFGREQAGYCGYFWRGPRDFTEGGILAAGGRSGPEVMGQRADWLAYVGAHDDSENRSTVLFDQDPANEDFPAHWFVRKVPYAVVNPSLAFFEELVLPAERTLQRRYRTVFATGAWDEPAIRAYLDGHPL